MDKITRCLWTGLGAQHMRGMFRSLQDAGRYLRPWIICLWTKKNIQIFYCALLLLNNGLTTESLQLLDPEKHSLVYWLKFSGMQYNRCKLHCWFCCWCRCCCSYLPTRFCKDSVSNRRKKHNQVSSSLPQTHTLKLLCHSLLLCSL